MTLRNAIPIPALDAYRAYAIASQWGSFVASGDPGACFYGFRYNDGRPSSEEHRAQCLAYLDDDLIPNQSVRAKAAQRRSRAERDAEAADLHELIELRWFLHHTELSGSTKCGEG